MPIPIILPKFGFTLESSTIVQWLKSEGDAVRAGDPICEVTTDKVNMEIEAPEAGTLYGLRYPAGADVPVTEVVCYLARPGEAIPVAAPTPSATATTIEARQSLLSPAPASETAMVTPLAKRVADKERIDLNGMSGTGPNGRIMRRDVEIEISARQQITSPDHLTDPYGKVRATPAARHAAAQAGIALVDVRGTGPQGRVQAADVQLAVSQRRSLPAAPVQLTANTDTHLPAMPAIAPTPAVALTPDGPQIVKLTGMRRTIATRLQKSHQDAPHIFIEMQVEMSAIEALRHKLKARHEKLSVTAILVRACAATLLRHKYVNATLQGDEISLWPHANIGVAVALDEGLIVPVIHHADELSLSATQAKLDELSGRARTNTLHISDMVDGTFTISNLGMYGVDRFTAIINPPQVAILAVGRIIKQFLPDDEGQPVLKSTMNLVLSADHRVIDGATAAQFLADLKRNLEEPALMLW
jgi:pyruvate dehydrogenase E2 component (dihydrolipoamide acetyltransferase)